VTEEKIAGASDLSDEGKLKLFIGGLYFQSESNKNTHILIY